MGNLANVIFITDLHIGSKGEETRGIDVRKNIKTIIKTLQSVDFDLLVVGGDVCFKEPKKDSYKWVKKQLDKLNKPYTIIPGNHDDNQMISAIFSTPLSGDNLYSLNILRSVPLIFLDSSQAELGQKQWNWLTGILNSIGQENILIFIHHPPVLAGVPYMDKKHAFKEIKQFDQLLDQFPDKKFHVYCGHYHVEKVIDHKNAQIHICPSLFFQIDKKSTSFKIDHKKIGYLKIALSFDQMKTNMHYVK